MAWGRGLASHIRAGWHSGWQIMAPGSGGEISHDGAEGGMAKSQRLTANYTIDSKWLVTHSDCAIHQAIIAT